MYCASNWVLGDHLTDYVRTEFPDMIFLTAGLIMLKETHTNLGSPSKVSLRALLKDHKGILGTAEDAFGELSGIIQEFKDDKKSVYFRKGSDITMGLMKMLKIGRVQFVIDFPPEAYYNAQKVGIKDWVFVPVEEVDTFTPSYTLCSNTPFGAEIVAKVDTIVRKRALTPQWQSHYSQYLSEDTKKLWEQEMKRVYSCKDVECVGY